MRGGWTPKVLAGWCALGLFWACGSDDKHPANPGASGQGGEGGDDAGAGGKAGAGKGGGAGRGTMMAGRGGTGQVGGQGGESGEMASAGKGGSAAGKGGGAGTTMMEDGGMGGEGGAPEPAGAGCTACAATACEDALARCDRSPRCKSWLDCINGCDDDSCLSSCDADAADSVLLTTPVYECLCSANACDSACNAFDTCNKTCEEGQGPPSSSSGVPGTPPALLTDTGLYTRASSNDPWTLAPWVQAFQPEYVLWSDGAEKERYIYLPRCEPVDTTDMDHWSFPVGTRIWKQFTRDGVRVETRFLQRFGSGVSDWMMASYQWALPVSSEPLDPEQSVLASSAGVANVNGTSHDIPALAGGCQNCHGKLSERVLGFSAIQLSHSLSGLTFTQLADRGILSNAPVRGGYHPPGDASAQAALGYLHTNCGNCHNETGIATATPPATESMWLRLLVNQTTVAMTHAQATAINHSTGNPNFPMDRIEPTVPSSSSIVVRMQRNPSIGEVLQMPPVGRELPDSTGIAAVSTWVNSLTP